MAEHIGLDEFTAIDAFYNRPVANDDRCRPAHTGSVAHGRERGSSDNRASVRPDRSLDGPRPRSPAACRDGSAFISTVVAPAGAEVFVTVLRHHDLVLNGAEDYRCATSAR